MKKKFVLLLLAFCTSNLFAQDISCDETACPEGGVRTNNIWTNHNLYYYIYNYPNNNLSITSTQYLTAVQNAFSTWSQYTDFTFTRTYNSSQADIILEWEDRINNCGVLGYNETAAAHSSPGKPDNGSAFIHFNDGINFTMTSPGYIMEAVALREIGHVLGLDYIPSNSSAAMYEGNVTITNLTGYDLQNFYDKYAFPGILTGPRLVLDNGQYHIDNLPSWASVVWSLTDSNYNNPNCLQGNYPYMGDCRIIRNNSYDLMNDNLMAYIKKGNIIALSQPLTKTVSAYSGFKGQYTSGNISGNINYTYYFSVRKNATTHITSANFAGGTVSYDPSATVPSSWVFNSANETLEFFVPSNSSNPVVIYLTDGCGNSYQLYAAPTSYYSLNVSNEGNCITVTLVEDDDASKDFTPDQPWTIEIINTSTGIVMNTLNPTSHSESISTVGWAKGIYIVKAAIGEEELTEKVIVK
jgi:hypothetical protein